jgi:hypothetical protein
VKHFIALIVLIGFVATTQAQYKVETISPPSNANLEVGGMDFTADGTLMMCTRTGDVWAYSKDGKWSKFAKGLQESLGLVNGDKPGEIYVLQRSEITRLVDEDLDGRADLYERFGSGWDFNGSYHEYAFGLVRDKEGNFYGNLGLAFFRGSPFKGTWLGTNKARYRGWHFRVTKDGKFEPLAPGLRAPNGICISPDGDIFTTDNQGAYVASSWLMHATKGDFLGHPDGLMWDKRIKPDKLKELIADGSRGKLNKIRKRPAVYLPFPQLGRSIGAPLFDTTEGKFGPYAGQVFAGDVIADQLMRCDLEKVGGEFQGFCITHIKGDGLSKGVNRLVFDKDGALWAGLTNRGWARGEKGLQKITFGGTPDQTIRTIKLAKGGFIIHFTKKVDTASPAIEAERWIYEYTNRYGAKRLEHQKNLPLTNIKVAADKMSMFVGVELKADHVYGFKVKDIGLKHDTGYYTLNRLR